MASKQAEGEGGGRQTGGKGSASLSRAKRRRLEREGALPEEGKGRSRRARGFEREEEGTSLGFTLRNGILGGAGLLCVAVGFLLLAQGSITLAPLLLVLGYGVLFPLALFL